MKLRRVVILSDESKVAGGQAVLVLLSAQLLRARGIEVFLVCGDEGHAPEYRKLGVEVIAAGSSPLLAKPRVQAFRRGLFDPDMRDFVAESISRLDQPGTVFHLHGWAQILSPSVFVALKNVADRCFIHAHDMFLACPNGVFMDFQADQPCARTPLSAACAVRNCDKRSYSHKLWRLSRHIVLRRCFDFHANWGGIFVINPAMIELLEKFGYARQIFKTLRNPARPFSVERIRAEDNEIFLYVGRLEPEKGVLTLAESAKRTGVPLVCVGDGSLRKELETRFTNVTVTGWLEHNGIAQWAAKSRAIVVPSMLPEPFGLVLAEAIHSGLPAAVSHFAMLAPEIEAEGFGFSFDVTNGDSFDQTLSRLRDLNAGSLRDMSVRGHKSKVRLGSDEDTWLAELLQRYEAALNPLHSRFEKGEA